MPLPPKQNLKLVHRQNSCKIHEVSRQRSILQWLSNQLQTQGHIPTMTIKTKQGSRSNFNNKITGLCLTVGNCSLAVSDVTVMFLCNISSAPPLQWLRHHFDLYVDSTWKRFQFCFHSLSQTTRIIFPWPPMKFPDLSFVSEMSYSVSSEMLNRTIPDLSSWISRSVGTLQNHSSKTTYRCLWVRTKFQQKGCSQRSLPLYTHRNVFTLVTFSAGDQMRHKH